MAAVVTRLLADAFSVCGGANFITVNLQNHFLGRKTLMDNELQVWLWKMNVDV